jgi:hypothetical protein
VAHRIRDYPEVVGKIIDRITLTDEEDFRCVSVRFSDRTAIHFELVLSLAVKPEFMNWKTGEGQLIKSYPVVEEGDMEGPKGVFLWVAFNVELHGPADLKRNRNAKGCATDLMKTLQYVIRQCLKDCHSAVIIGVLAGVVVCFGVLLNDRVLKIDDPCGAISVHGFCGWLGAVCVGIFADGTYGAGWNGIGASSNLGRAGQGVTGLLHGDSRQFLSQLFGATLCAAWAFGVTYGVFWVVNRIKVMRVAPEVEAEGLDVPEFGFKSYPEDAIVTAEA